MPHPVLSSTMPFARFAVVHLLRYLNLLYEADEEENAKTLLIFHSVNSVFLPGENMVLEIVLRMCYNKPVKVPLTVVHHGKILHAGMDS